MKILTKTELTFLQLVLFLLGIRLYETNIHRGNLIKRVHLDTHIRFLESIISEGDEEESNDVDSNLPSIITTPVIEPTTPTSTTTPVVEPTTPTSTTTPVVEPTTPSSTTTPVTVTTTTTGNETIIDEESSSSGLSAGAICAIAIPSIAGLLGIGAAAMLIKGSTVSTAATGAAGIAQTIPNIPSPNLMDTSLAKFNIAQELPIQQPVEVPQVIEPQVVQPQIVEPQVVQPQPVQEVIKAPMQQVQQPIQQCNNYKFNLQPNNFKQSQSKK